MKKLCLILLFLIIISNSAIALTGDLDNNGKVDIKDIKVIAENFWTNDASSDINSDGTVNLGDLVIVAKHFGESSKDQVLPNISKA